MKIKNIGLYFKNRKTYLYWFKYKIYFFFKTHIYRCNVAYVGSIIHGNLGDQAIAQASIDYLKQIGLKPIDIPSDRINDKILNYLRKKRMFIILRGGGNIGNDWIWEEEFHRNIISKFPDNKIMFFPETIHFSNDKEGQLEANNSKIIYSQHKNLTIACRELNSYNISKSLFSNNKSILCPDIVFTFKNKHFKKDNKTNKVCFIIREDREKVSKNASSFKDIETFFLFKGYSIERSSTLISHRITKFQRKKEISSFLKMLTAYDYIVTDRLHAMIFSYITDVPCIILDNNTKKVSSSYNWIKNSSRVMLYSNISDLDEFLLRKKSANVPLFDKFDSLKESCIFAKKIPLR